MIYPLQHLPVNWIDGMKISKQHFIDTGHCLQDAVRDSISIHLTPFNYGLLPTHGSFNNFSIDFNEKPSNVLEVTLKHCQAITIGGARISILPLQQSIERNALTASLQGANEHSTSIEVSWYEIILIANPYDRIPEGTPDLEENPPRHPFTNTQYSLQILPTSQVNPSELGPYYLIVGRIKNTGGKLSVEKDYIPPCTNLQSHPGLINYYEQFASRIQHIQGASFKIIKKIIDKNKPSSIAKNYRTVCEKLLECYAIFSFEFHTIIPHAPPVQLVGNFSRLASSIYTTLQCISSEEREELLKYIFEWCDVTPKELEEALADLVEVRYQHYKTEESMKIVARFLEIISYVWKKMDGLEFIGQRKENIVVTKETVSAPIEAPKKRWSILD